VITWSRLQADNFDVVARRFDSDGDPLGSTFLVNGTTDGFQAVPALNALDNGGFIVTWVSGSDTFENYDVYAREYDADANAVGDEMRVNVTVTGDQLAAYGQGTVADLGDGTIAVVWSGQGSGDPSDIFYRLFTLGGGSGSGDGTTGTTGDDDLTGTPDGDDFMMQQGGDRIAVTERHRPRRSFRRTAVRSVAPMEDAGDVEAISLSS